MEGDFGGDMGPLHFSCTKLELTIGKGEIAEGAFNIISDDGTYTCGYIYTTDDRMKALTEEFSGTKEEISYRFDGSFLEEGEVIKGEFVIISNHGEFYLPFCVTVAHAVISSSLGEIKNFFHFANLAKSYPDEAVELFYSQYFKHVFENGDREYYSYYKGLSAHPGNVRNVEEFLIAIGKKQKMEFLIKPGEISFEYTDDIEEASFTITRNGWGYTELTLSAEGEFFTLDKGVITDADFEGNLCKIRVLVDGAALHAGRNFGRILITGAYTEIMVPLTVTMGKLRPEAVLIQEEKHLIAEMMGLYQDFRLKKMGTQAWMKESTKLAERLLDLNEENVRAKLFQAQLLITEKRFHEADWLLDQAQGIMERLEEKDVVAEAYYLYLMSLIHTDEDYLEMVGKQVLALYRRNREEWRIAWLYLYVSGEYDRSVTRRWMFLEEQFERGCHSPVLYIEALLVLNSNPSLLSKLGDFERQILQYAAKHEVIGPDVRMQMVYLLGREREFSPCLYRIMTACYAQSKDDELLQEICSMLIKGNKAGKEYFKWYRLGVEREIRITRLYEYYMMSVDTHVPVAEAEILPKMVLMYFSYQNNLNYEQAAYLYANIYKNRTIYPELYETYQHGMEQFVVNQLMHHRINQNLAYLYKNILVPGMLTEQMADAFAKVAFMQEIRFDREDIRRVIVLEAGMNREKVYPVGGKSAVLSLPGTENSILLEDEDHNRYTVSIPYTLEKLLSAEELLKAAVPYVEQGHDINIYSCFKNGELRDIRENNESRFASLYAEEGVSEDVRLKLGFMLIRYYYDNDKIVEMDECLRSVPAERCSVKEKEDVLKYMILRGMEREAYEWIKPFGPYGLDAKTLVRLASTLLTDETYMESDELYEMIHYAFSKGKFDRRCLRYLILHKKGLVKKMRDVWKLGQEYAVESGEIAERILLQMLFTGAYVAEKMEIFKSFMQSENGRGSKLAKAFLSQCTYEYYVKERLTDAYVFEEIAVSHRAGEEVSKMCRLAYVKYYAENPDAVTEETYEILIPFMQSLIKEGIRLKMFQAFPEIQDPYITGLMDRTIVEYRTKEGAKARMHYRIGRGGKEEELYFAEEMQEVCGGVCFKEFVLFFGERLQYYIVEIKDGEEQVTESVTVQAGETASIEGKYNQINDLSISMTLEDYETANKLLSEYTQKEFMQSHLFSVK